MVTGPMTSRDPIGDHWPHRCCEAVQSAILATAWLNLYMYIVWIYIWHLCRRFMHYKHKNLIMIPASRDFVRRYLFTAWWRRQVERLLKQYMITPHCCWRSLRCSRMYKLSLSVYSFKCLFISTFTDCFHCPCMRLQYILVAFWLLE